MTGIYKLDGKCFRYDEENSIVEYVAKADKEMIKDDEEYKKENGHSLYDIGADGYMVLDSAGLRRENWKNKELRNEYLSAWADELDEEFRCMENDFIKYELPNMMV